MTRTGRPKSPERMVRRTVRNRPDVDAVLVRMAKKYSKGLAEVLREACEEKAKSYEERFGPLEDAFHSAAKEFIRKRDEMECRVILAAIAKREGEG